MPVGVDLHPYKSSLKRWRDPLALVRQYLPLSLEAGFLQDFGNIRELKISGIKSIGSGTFEGLNELLSLYLAQNEISSIDGAFHGLTSL